MFGPMSPRKLSEPAYNYYNVNNNAYLTRRSSDSDRRVHYLPHITRSRTKKKSLEVTSANISKFLQSRGKFGRKKLSLMSNDGEDVIRFGEAIRKGDLELIENFIDNNGEMFAHVTFYFEVMVERDQQSMDERFGVQDTYDSGPIKREQANLEVSALHLAIMAQNSTIVEMMILGAMALDATRTRSGKEGEGHETILKILKKKTVIEFHQKDSSLYSKADQMIDGMNTFHVAARYHSPSLEAILELVEELDLKDMLNSHSTHLKQAPIHLTAKYGEAYALRMLIENGAEIECKDKRGFTPLHWAAKAGIELNAITLLECGADPNAVGIEEYRKTPLHRSRSARMVQILLNYHANPYATMANKNKGEREELSVFEVLLARNPAAAAKILYKGIDDNGQDLDSSDLLLIYDLKVFRQEAGLGKRDENDHVDEMAAHSKMVYLKLRELLKNPLAETYLHLKWELTKKFFRANVIFYTLFTITLTSMALLATNILKQCHCQHNNQTSNAITEPCANVNEADLHYKFPNSIQSCLEDETDQKRILFWILFGFSTLGIITLAIREFLQAIHSWNRYIREKENLLELLIIVFFIAYLILLFFNVSVGQHFGAFSIFFSWMEMTLLIGRYPQIGIYIYMIAHVMWLLLTILLVYSTSLLAFAFGFHLLLPNNEAFDNPVTSTIKVLVMMIGEFDFEDNFTWSQVKLSGSNGSTQILFVIFIFVTSVTISNLIVGLTVNKTEELFKEAGVIRLEKTVLQVMGLEDVLIRKQSVAAHLPKRFKNTYFKLMQLFPHIDGICKQKVSKICVRPFEMKRKNLFMKEKDSTTTPLEGVYEGKMFPVYIYDEDKDAKGKKIGYDLPGWIVQKTLDTIRERMAINNLALQQSEDNGYSGGTSTYTRHRFTPRATPKFGRRVDGSKQSGLKRTIDIRNSKMVNARKNPSFTTSIEIPFLDDDDDDSRLSSVEEIENSSEGTEINVPFLPSSQ